MKVWIGVLLFLAGGAVALLGYAPLFSPQATSLAMIIIGGLSLSAGTFLMLFASAKSLDLHDVDRNDLIRP